MNKVEQEFIDKGLAKMRPNGKWFILTREDSMRWPNKSGQSSCLNLSNNDWKEHERDAQKI